MELTCPKCGYTGEPVVTESGVHQKASCPSCGAYIKFLAKEWTQERALDFRLPFKQFKGEAIRDVAKTQRGRDYLLWLVDSRVATGNVLKAIMMSRVALKF